MTKHIYRFSQDFRRMGSLNGVFVSTPHEIEKILGKTVYFGEVLGKHSDVECEIGSDNIAILTSDADFIEKFEELGMSNGFNPLDYVEESDDEEDGE